MHLPSWLLALPLLTLPFGAAAQPITPLADPTCRPIAARMIQEALDRGGAVARRMHELDVQGDDRSAPRPGAATGASPVTPSAPRASAAEAKADAPARRASASPAQPTDRSVGSLADTSVEKSKKSGPSSYSRTNTQEDAVDEGDIVKTNGRTIFHVSCSRGGEASGCRDELRIYKSWPADRTQLLGRHRLGDGVQQIYLHGDQVIVLSRAHQAHGARLDARELRPGVDFDTQVSRVQVLDVADPSRPRAVGELSIEGTMVESRMIGARLFLATHTPRLRLPAALEQELHGLAMRGVVSADDAIARLDRRWDTFVSADPGLPHIGNASRSAALYGCAELTVTDPTMSGQVLNVAQIDLSGQVQATGLTGFTPGAPLYASDGAMYVASVGAVPPNSGWSSATTIRKITLGSAGPRFAAQGAVRGTLLNQFSMSEHAGHLRVATTDHWISNNLYVLREQSRELATVGKLEDLGRNERIYAVRMMGDRGYLVTFRRTDPLYTLDLSDPTRPALLGELKIDGFSNYLHPLGENHLLAIGQDADASGRTTGFHLQVFDVTNPRAPVRKFHEKLAAGSVSDAQDDHHAFFFEPTTHTLSVPWKSEQYWGLIAYRVDPQRGFVDLGRVNHALMYKRHFQNVCAKADVAECGRPNHWWSFVSRPAIAVDRLVAIDDQLYSASPAGLMVHKIGSSRLSETTSVLVDTPAWAPGRTAQPRIVSSW